jgi:hypothetical protein
MIFSHRVWGLIPSVFFSFCFSFVFFFSQAFCVLFPSLFRHKIQ